jgi:hypothetical protein
MKKTQKKPLIVSLLIILIFALGGCSSLLGPTRPVYSYPTEPTSTPATEPQPEPTPIAPQPKPAPPQEPPKPATPPEEFVFQADADGIAYVNLIDWPFSIILTDPLIILFDAEETGTFEIIHDDFASFPLYMSIYSFDQDDALADNLIEGNPAESLQVSLEAGNTYILGIGVLSPKDLNKTTRFSVEYLGESVVPEPEYVWVETPHPHNYDIPVEEVEKIELELEEAAQPKVYPIAKDITIADGAQAVDMVPFKDNPASVSKSELRGNIEGVLTAADSPYTVVGNIAVEAGKSLVIEEGVILRFRERTLFQINGTLDVRGAAGKEVVFTADSSNQPGFWGGIIFQDGSKANLKHTRILYAGADTVVEGAWRKSAMYTLGNAAPTIEQSQVALCSGDVIQLFHSSSPSITKSDLNDTSFIAQIYSPSAGFTNLQYNRYTAIKNHGIKLAYQNLQEVDTVLKPFDNIPYYSEGLNIRQDAGMTLAEGVVLKFGGGSGIEVAGSMKAVGSTGKPVIITSANDDIGGDTNGDGSDSKAEAGQWLGIRVNNDGEVDLKRTSLRYTGMDTVIEGGWRRAALSATDTASITVSDSEISDSIGDGFNLFKEATVSVSSTLFDGVQWPIILFDPSALPTTFSGNRYEKVAHRGIRIGFKDLNGVEFTLTSYDGLPYYSEGLSIRQDAGMTLAEGVVLKFGGGSGIEVAGSMKAAGSTGKPVIITSANDDIGGDTNGDGSDSKAEAGQWLGIQANNDGKVDLQRTSLRYTGMDTVIEGAWRKVALSANDTASITVSDSEIVEGVDGVQTFKDARIVINNSSLEGLRGKGVENSGSRTIDARQLWWGSPSGPTTENNPSGTGFAIVGDVVYSPYLKNRPRL